MTFHVLTLFPEMFASLLSQSMIKSAIDNGVVRVSVVNVRDFATDKHKTADDYAFGGGPGMVMKPEPVFLAAESVLGTEAGRAGGPGVAGGPGAGGPGGAGASVAVVLLSPQGRKFDQKLACELATRTEIVLICGHYKGVDERIRQYLATDEISIGDFVITGGELAAMIIIDAVTRLRPGVLGDFASAEGDTFYGGLLEHANYTKPRDFRGHGVPEVLLGGNHEEIRRWRRMDSLRRTLLKRPDLLESAEITDEDRRFLKEIRADLDRN